MKIAPQVLEPETIKTVGHRLSSQSFSPHACHNRALALIHQADCLNPNPKPRGFVFKAASWKAYDTWRRRQKNPRLW